MASKETFCPDCRRVVGLMTPPPALSDRRRTTEVKRVKHGDPGKPRDAQGRMVECAGSRLTMPAVAVYDVQHDASGRRRVNRELAS